MQLCNNKKIGSLGYIRRPYLGRFFYAVILGCVPMIGKRFRGKRVKCGMNFDKNVAFL